MASTKARLLSMAAVGLMAAPFVTSGGGAEAATTGLTRIGGSDRYGTSLMLSRSSFPQGASVVYIARGDVLADALAGSSLTGGPMLLAPKTDKPSDALLYEVKRLNPSRVVVLGGEDVVSPKLASTLAQGRTLTRLQGSDRYSTAVAVSQYAFPKGASRVAITNGTALADAVSGGSLKNTPVLLTPPKSSPSYSKVQAEIKRLNPTTVTALGGKSVVPDATLKALAPKGKAVNRWAGNNRYSTSAAIATNTWPKADTVYITTGKAFADAVSAGNLKRGPILLVDLNAPLTDTFNYLKKAAPQRIIVLGSDRALSESLASAARDAAQGVIAAGKPAGWSDYEAQILHLTNAQRLIHGLKPLVPENGCMKTTANKWARYLQTNNKFEHGSFSARLMECHTNRAGGENIAEGYPTPAATVEGWMNSPKHRANILDPDYTSLAVAEYRGMVVQNFLSNPLW